MKIAIYHPQLGNFGGGEYLALVAAQAMRKEGSVAILTYSDVQKRDLEAFFNLDLSGIDILRINCFVQKLPGLRTIKPKILFRRAIREMQKYDLVIDTGTNGWFSRNIRTRTVCYIHYPFFYSKKRGLKRFFNPFLVAPVDAFRYDAVLCNSNFTKEGLKKYLGTQADEVKVVYPPVEVGKIRPSKNKKNIIVSVGRFSPEKKHEVMIGTFKKLESELPGFELHLIGSYQKGLPTYSGDYLEMLKREAEGHRIYFHLNMNHDNVLRFLEKSRIYWHARGYGETDPVEYENFGITTVEAMAAGCVPIVINLGAQPEIVDNGKNGLCWDSPGELADLTVKLIGNPELERNLRAAALRSSGNYSRGRFEASLRKILFNHGGTM